MPGKKHNTLLAYFIPILISLLPFVIVEVTIAMALRFPAMSQYLPRKALREIYKNEFRNLIQYEPQSGQYDPQLTYTLKPGQFWFANPEFKNHYFVNSAGVRDSQEDLTGPDAVVLGDSVAMGWGVDQNETYASLLEEQTGLKVLNASVSSYGTAREMFLLDRLDLSKLKYVIIHYMGNDAYENVFFLRNNNRLVILTEDEYNKVVQGHLKSKKYYPGKYLVAVVRYALAKEHEPYSLFDDGFKSNEEKYFINVLMNASHAKLDHVKLIVISTDRFIAELNKVKNNPAFPSWTRNLTGVPISSKLDNKCFFALDDHINKHGHEVIAGEVLKVMGDIK